MLCFVLFFTLKICCPLVISKKKYQTMKGLIMSNYAVLGVLMIMFLSKSCNGEDEIAEVAPVEKTEQDALYLAIQGFVGESWNGSDLYPDPCGWTPIQGVSCDLYNGFWYVTALSIGPIYENSLACSPNAKFNAHLFGLTHLKTLSFFNCFTSPKTTPVTLPTKDWDKLAFNLESLEFRSNRGLIGNIPTSLINFQKLRSLVLMENGLYGELPPSIGNLITLQRLVLAGNSFSGKIPMSIGGLNKLLILDMSRNALNGTLPSTIGDLVSLIKLDLSNNFFEGTLPKEVENLINLTLLDVTNNKLSNGISKSLENLSSLKELILSSNPIGGDLENVEWQKMQNLVILDLSKTGLVGKIPNSITNLKNLRFLGLNNNYLTGNLPISLSKLPSITAMYLNGNNLSGELKFSSWFYEKMQRRFGVWGNRNLCFPIGLMSTNYVPIGVNPCQN